MGIIGADVVTSAASAALTPNTTVIGSTALTLVLSDNAIGDTAAPGDVIGTFSFVEGRAVSDVILIFDPDAQFALDGADLVVRGTLVDGVHTVVVRARAIGRDWTTATFSVTVSAAATLWSMDFSKPMNSAYVGLIS